MQQLATSSSSIAVPQNDWAAAAAASMVVGQPSVDAARMADEPSAAGSAAAAADPGVPVPPRVPHRVRDVSTPLVAALHTSVQTVLDQGPDQATLAILHFRLNRLHGSVFEPDPSLWWTPDWQEFARIMQRSIRGHLDDVIEAMEGLMNHDEPRD